MRTPSHCDRILPPCLRKHGFEQVVNQSHIGELRSNRHERVFEGSVVLAGLERFVPFFKDGVGNLLLQMDDCHLHIRRDGSRFGEKALKNAPHRRFEIVDVLRHRVGDAVAPDIRSRDDRQRGLQFCLDMTLVGVERPDSNRELSL